MSDISYSVLARSESSAWSKFCAQRFGPLKPDPAAWKIERSEAEGNAKALGLSWFAISLKDEEE